MAELDGRKAPIAQEGRDAAYQLIDMLLRDPAFALRGAVVLAVLLFKSPILVGILCVGMVADLFVTLLMDARLFMPYAVLREHQFRLRGLEYQLLDGNPGAAGTRRAAPSEMRACRPASANGTTMSVPPASSRHGGFSTSCRSARASRPWSASPS